SWTGSATDLVSALGLSLAPKSLSQRFEQQSNDNKEFGRSAARVRSGGRAIAVEWQNCGRTWGNPRCPCLHSDPLIPDCKPGEMVRARGRLWFEA
ncbi:MAG: hypothetical protein KIT09_02460, partial [Bryobacteraceae bacterium]|nr:hypothetical protein [Bryobacteraceae bacterium]